MSRCAALADAGASRLAIHARRAHDAARSPARWRDLQPICRALAARGCEAIVNGDALDGRAAATLRRAAGCAAVLVGRGALLAGTCVFGAGEQEARGDAAADGATLAMCRRYAQLCAEVGNCVANSRFVLQWMLHARLREARGDGDAGDAGDGGDGDGDGAVSAPSTEESGSDAAAARRRINAALEALEAAATMADVAQAVGAELGAQVAAQVATQLEADGGREELPSCAPSLPPPPPPPPPPPHARRYLGNYFARLDEHGDWAGVPPRGQYAVWHDADDAPVKDGSRRPTAARRPPARALPRAVPHALPRAVLPPTSKKRTRSYAAAGGARGAGGAAAGGAGVVEAPPSQPLVAPGAKRKKSRGVRLSKAEREARRKARGVAEAKTGTEQRAPEEAQQD